MEGEQLSSKRKGDACYPLQDFLETKEFILSLESIFLFFFRFGLGSWRRDCSSLAPLVVAVLVLTKKHPCDLYIFEMVAFNAKKI